MQGKACIMKNRRFLSSLSLEKQLSLFIAFSIILILFSVISYMTFSAIRTQTRLIFDDQKMLLELRLQNTRRYFDGLNAYSLHLRNDDKFLRLLASAEEYTYEEKNYIQNLVKNSYYSREDMLSYQLYIANKNTCYEISQENRNISVRDGSDIRTKKEYESFSSGRYYRAFAASEKEGELLTYYRTIIRIQDQRPLAYVVMEVDDSYFKQALSPYLEAGEINVLAGEDGTVFFAEGIPKSDYAALEAVLRERQDSAQDSDEDDLCYVKFKNERYLFIGNTAEDGWQLFTLIPRHYLGRKSHRTQAVAFLFGILSAAATSFLIILLVRFFTKPLKALSRKLKSAGGGNFTELAAFPGASTEIQELAHADNQMLMQIDALIKKNYIIELNRRDAQLLALKAQINPHFLNNTLQALSSEAIENDQMKINDMVIALSSMLKYTIQDGDEVSVRTELSHVEDYLFLQKVRFEERLSYEIHIPDELLMRTIPKISIINLVENAITHSMEKVSRSVRIDISASLAEGKCHITVTDDGTGIPADRLEEIMRSIRSPEDVPKGKHIGLKNLANRLRLMYGDDAGLNIYSIEYTGTSIVMEIPDV